MQIKKILKQLLSITRLTQNKEFSQNKVSDQKIKTKEIKKLYITDINNKRKYQNKWVGRVVLHLWGNNRF